MEKILTKYTGIVLALLLSFFAIKSLLGSGYFPVHDNLQVERINEMASALKDGQFPVRWVYNLGYGYGYPLFNFYGPLPYYIGAFFNIVGLSLVVSAKLMFGIGILISGVSMYLLGKEIWGKVGGIISAVLYVYLPYHAVLIYVRGAVGEYYAYALLPLLVLSFLKLNSKRVEKWIFIGGLTYSGIILSHNISAMLITMITLIYMFAYELIVRRINKSQVTVLLLGLCLSAFFWMPAVVESNLTQVSKVVGGGSYYADHFVEPLQLWSSVWGYAGSAPMSEQDGMSFKLGKVHIITALVALVCVLYKRDKKYYPLLAILTLLFIGSVFMMLPISKNIWDRLPPLKYVQFPLRFLMYAGFALSVIAGGVSMVVQRYRLGMVLAVAIFILVTINVRALPKLELLHFMPSEYYLLDDEAITSDHNLRWLKSEKSDEYLLKYFFQPQREEDISLRRVNFDADITEDRSNLLKFNITALETAEISMDIAYFPGWMGYIDGEEVVIKRLTRGISITVPTGAHNVMLRLENTPVRTLANLTSVISLGVLLVLLVKYAKS